MKIKISKTALGLAIMMVSINGFSSVTVETLDDVRSMIHIDKVTTAANCHREMNIQKNSLNEELRNYLGAENATPKIQAICAAEMNIYLKNYCSSRVALFAEIETLMAKDKVQAIRSNLGVGADDRAVGEVVNYKIQKSLDMAKKRWSGNVSHFATVAKCPIVKKDKKDFENELHILIDFAKQRFQDTLITATSAGSKATDKTSALNSAQ